jgi:small subunit ribosomal protein S6
MLRLDTPAIAVQEIERLEGISEDVIRFMTVRVEEHETEPSIQMRKQDRDERGDRDRGFGGRGRGDRGGFGGREGGSTFRSRPPRDGDRGPRPPRDGDAPRTPRPPRDATPGSEG